MRRALAAALAAVAACLTTQAGAAGPATAAIRLVNSIYSSDWTLDTWSSDGVLHGNIMEGLFEIDEALALVPRLAESHAVSADGLTYTVRIKKGVAWSDGRPLRAQDFVDGLERVLNPLTKSIHARSLFAVRGARDYHQGTLREFKDVGAQARDGHTLVFTLVQRCPHFLKLMAIWNLFPVRRDLIELHGRKWSEPPQVAVLGPFAPVSYEKGVRYVLKPNMRYHGPKPALAEVRLEVVNDDGAAISRFRAGTLDLIGKFNHYDAGDLVLSPAYRSRPCLRTNFLQLNPAVYPLTLPKFRQALAMAIDRAQLATVYTRPFERATSIIPYALLPEGRDSAPRFDPGAARRLLEEIGVTPAKGRIELEVLSLDTDQDATFAEFLKGQLKANLGIDVKVRLAPLSTFQDDSPLVGSALQIRDITAAYNDPHSFFEMIRAITTGAHAGRLDDALQAALRAPDSASRAKKYREALELLQRTETLVVPLLFPRLSYLVSPKLLGVRTTALDAVVLRDASK